ncbi:phosphoesterase family-domain-containing protein [Cunninghamella echinulata]|nr:phosphoesterase family-domain-containing protein [Cunninghamella echinulata]
MKLFSIAATCLASIFIVKAAPVSNIVSGKHFDRVVIFIFENENYSKVHSDPFFGSLATKYNALTHPSQPNYIGLITGSLDGVTDDSEVTVDRPSIIDLLEAKGISWKGYMEGYDGSSGCNTVMKSGTYARKHDPFMSVQSIQTNKDRCAKIVNADELLDDIAKDQVPQFVFYTPDMNNDGHDTSLTFASNWFQGFLEGTDGQKGVIDEPAFNTNTMFVSTWDEAKDYTIANQVQTVLFGPDFKKSSTATSDNTKYDHYSLLHTIEDNWSLGDLGQKDHSANLINL